MTYHLENTIVLVAAILAVAGVVAFVFFAFPDTLVGQALFGEDECGCTQVERPVCTDKGTAENRCIAFCYNANIIHDGQC